MICVYESVYVMICEYVHILYVPMYLCLCTCAAKDYVGKVKSMVSDIFW